METRPKLKNSDGVQRTLTDKLADEILKDLLEINKLQGNSIKKMKADQNGVFYVEQEISVEDFLKTL